MKRTHSKLNTAETQTKRFGLGMLSPTVIILLIMTAYPLIFTFFYSFTDYNLLRNLRSPAKRPLFPAVHLEHRQVHHFRSHF